LVDVQALNAIRNLLGNLRRLYRRSRRPAL
jgi:hypothetical protein